MAEAQEDGKARHTRSSPLQSEVEHAQRHDEDEKELYFPRTARRRHLLTERPRVVIDIACSARVRLRRRELRQRFDVANPIKSRHRGYGKSENRADETDATLEGVES